MGMRNRKKKKCPDSPLPRRSIRSLYLELAVRRAAIFVNPRQEPAGTASEEQNIRDMRKREKEKARPPRRRFAGGTRLSGGPRMGAQGKCQAQCLPRFSRGLPKNCILDRMMDGLGRWADDGVEVAVSRRAGSQFLTSRGYTCSQTMQNLHRNRLRR